jgi:hypothetical protein
MAQEIGLPKGRTENQTMFVWTCWQCESWSPLSIKGELSALIMYCSFCSSPDMLFCIPEIDSLLSNLLTSVEALLSAVQCSAAQACCCVLCFNVKEFYYRSDLRFSKRWPSKVLASVTWRRVVLGQTANRWRQGCQSYAPAALYPGTPGTHFC